MKTYFISYTGLKNNGNTIFGNQIFEYNIKNKPTYNDIIDWENEIKSKISDATGVVILNFDAVSGICANTLSGIVPFNLLIVDCLFL